METLVLNVAEIPVSVIPIRRAVTLILSDKAIIREAYPEMFYRSAIREIPSPSVIQCTHSDYMPKKYTNILPFTRKNVYIRDRGVCQYCGRKVSLSSFSFDHVIPKCLGGRSLWSNIVVACFRCNAAKGHKSTDKFKEPLTKPYAPKLSKAAPAHLVNKIANTIPIESWEDFIYWEIILEQ